jgi:hypothetical protein
MNAMSLASTLLADIDPQRFELLRSGFSAPRPEPNYTALLVLVVALGCVLLLALVIRRRGRRSERRATDYLKLLAEVAELTPAELEDLRTVAALGRLPQPGCLLLSPANLAHGLRAAERWREDAALRARLQDLSVRVFGAAFDTRANREPN